MFIRFRRYVSKSEFLLMREKVNGQILVMNLFLGGGGYDYEQYITLINEQF